MTTAALQRPVNWLVLEQHYVPGGFTHSEGPYHWDVGVHAIGGQPESHAGAIAAPADRWKAGVGEPRRRLRWFIPGVRIDFPIMS